MQDLPPMDGFEKRMLKKAKYRAEQEKVTASGANAKIKKKDKELNSGNQSARLLTDFLISIGQEATELDKNEDGEDIIVSKSQKLASLMWEMALGEDIYEQAKDGTITTVHRGKKPDKAMIKLIYERLEGKPANQDKQELEKNKTGVLADRIDEQIRMRISNAGGITATAEGNNNQDQNSPSASRAVSESQ